MLCSLIGQAPALLLSKSRDTRACDCTVSVFLALSDSMKDMVKIWTGPIRSNLEPSVCPVMSHRQKDGAIGMSKCREPPN